MSDKRSVATDALDTLGTAPLDDQQKRDAIHLAVEPVIAGERLNPGERVTVTDGVAMSADGDEVLGIVDPFLTKPVRKGQRFWFVMLPRTIRSLRHVWSHPAFADEPVIGVPAMKSEPDKAASERWLRDFCAAADCPGYEQVMGKVADIADGNNDSWDAEYMHFDGRDAHGEIPAEFWTHAEIVLGRKIANRPTYFSCAC